jgi:hypothetical protein
MTKKGTIRKELDLKFIKSLQKSKEKLIKKQDTIQEMKNQLLVFFSGLKRDVSKSIESLDKVIIDIRKEK